MSNLDLTSRILLYFVYLFTTPTNDFWDRKRRHYKVVWPCYTFFAKNNVFLKKDFLKWIFTDSYEQRQTMYHKWNNKKELFWPGYIAS